MNGNEVLKPLINDARKTVAQLKKAMNSDDETLIKSQFLRMKNIMKRSYRYILHEMLVCRKIYVHLTHLKKEVALLEKQKERCYNEIVRMERAKGSQNLKIYFSKEDEERVSTEIKRRQKHLVNAKQKLDKMEQEYIIKQEELEIAIQDTNLAKSSYYFLSDAEIELFEKQRGKILAGVEKYGSIALACKKDKTITMKVSSIMHYANKHKQFHDDLEIAKQVFKDNLDAEIIDRALNGTLNPVFQKGEYIGDFPVKDNKLLVEVAKAKLPKEYNPRAYAAANPQSVGGTTINILSFDGVDETKKGYAKNIGVVKSVDDSGRVQRITQNKKMLDFYKNKEGAQIIEAEVVKDGKTAEKQKSEKSDS